MPQSAAATGNPTFERRVTLNGVFTPAECDRIIALGHALGLRPAGTAARRLEKSGAGVTAERMPTTEDPGREAEYAFFEIGPDSEWIYNRMAAAVMRANGDYWRFRISESELIQFTRYGAGQFHDWHLDLGITPPESLRKLSLTMQLSDPGDYTGGELQFMVRAEALPASRRRGSLVVFPSYILHRVRPVESGVRYALVQWVAGNAPFS